MSEPRKLQETAAAPHLKGRWVNATAYGLLLLIVWLFQMSPFGLPEILGARPLLLVPLTVFAAMFEGPLTGGIFGAVAGFLWDVSSARLLGLNALLLLGIGCACGLLVHMLIRNNLLSALLMAAAAVVTQSLFDWFFYTVIWDAENCLYVLWHLTLPDMLYTIVTAPLLYYISYRVARGLKRSEKL